VKQEAMQQPRAQLVTPSRLKFRRLSFRRIADWLERASVLRASVRVELRQLEGTVARP